MDKGKSPVVCNLKRDQITVLLSCYTGKAGSLLNSHRYMVQAEIKTIIKQVSNEL